MIYKILLNALRRLMTELDVDASFDNNNLTIVIKLNDRIIFRKIINLSIPS